MTLGLQSGGSSSRGPTGAGSGGAAANAGPTLAGGVAPVSGGTVVATVMSDASKVGQRVRTIQVAGAPIDQIVLQPSSSHG